MKKILLSAAGVFVLAMAAFTGSAQAQCWWTGFGYACAVPPVVYPGAAYPAFNGYDFQDYRLRPGWLPTYPGPRPG